MGAFPMWPPDQHAVDMRRQAALGARVRLQGVDARAGRQRISQCMLHLQHPRAALRNRAHLW